MFPIFKRICFAFWSPEPEALWPHWSVYSHGEAEGVCDVSVKQSEIKTRPKRGKMYLFLWLISGILCLDKLGTDAHIHDTPPWQLILISRGNAVIGAGSQLGRRSHSAGGSGYTAASQTPHSQQTSIPSVCYEVQACCTRREESIRRKDKGFTIVKPQGQNLKYLNMIPELGDKPLWVGIKKWSESGGKYGRGKVEWITGV